jgi:ectoine hydroxylase-related dioxygenase (phytanoyl-CoA dioxygenase family)
MEAVIPPLEATIDTTYDIEGERGPGKFPAPASIDKARTLLGARLERLSALGDWFEIDLGDGKSVYLNGEQAVLTDTPPSTPITSKIVIHADDFLEILSGEMDARRAVFFTLMAVGGSMEAVMRMFNALTCAPRQPALTTDLPKPVSDRDRALDDLKQFGYCLVEGALTGTEVQTLRSRLVDQAQGEAAAGVANFEGHQGANQRVWNLINKGQCFEELLLNPIFEEFSTPILGRHAFCGSYQANIAGPGGKIQCLHYDQMLVNPKIVDRPLALQFAIYLDDVVEENGATRVIPGSHLGGREPYDQYSLDGTVPAEGPAGTVLIFDGRLFHGAGANGTTKPRHILFPWFLRYYMKSADTTAASLRPEVEARMSDRLKAVLGFRCTGGLGGANKPVEGQIAIKPTYRVGPIAADGRVKLDA